MALDVAQGTLAAPASAGQQTITVGFEPKVVLFWWGEATAFNSFTVHAHGGFGWATGTAADDQYALGVSADDNLTSNQAKPRFQNDACILQITDANPGVVTLEANLFEAFSVTSTGFKLDWVTTVSGAKVHYLALGGADITNVHDATITAGAATGNVSTTAPGFQPDFVLFLTDGKATSFPGTGGKGLNVGAAISSTERWATGSSFKAQNAKAGKAGMHQLSTRCWLTEKGNSTEMEADFVSMDTNGFTFNVTKAKGDALHAYLAIKGSVDLSVALGVETQRTSVGTKANTVPGFQPDGLFLVGCNNVATVGSIADTKYSFGASDGTNESSRWAGNVDNPAGNTEADDYDADAKVFIHVTPGSPTAVDAECDLSSFDTNGFTLDWTTADGTAREFCWWAFKGAAGGTTGTGTQTLAKLTQAGVGVQKFIATGSLILASLTQAGVGVMQPEGTGAQTLASLLQAGTGVQTFTATGAQTLASLLQTGAGVEAFTATGAQTLASLIQAGVGVMQPSATGAQTLASLLQAGVGVHTEPGATGTGTQILAAPVQAGVGVMQPAATGAQTLAPLTQAGVGVEAFTATGAQTVASLIQAGVGLMQPSATGAQTLASLLQAGVGVHTEAGATGTGTQTLASLLQAGVGVMQPEGTGAQILAPPVQAGVGVETFTATGAQTLASLSQAGVGVEAFTATGAQVLAPPVQAGVGVEAFTATGAHTLAPPVQAGVGVTPPEGSGASILAAVTQGGLGIEIFPGSGVQILPAVIQSGIGAGIVAGQTGYAEPTNTGPDGALATSGPGAALTNTGAGAAAANAGGGAATTNTGADAKGTITP